MNAEKFLIFLQEDMGESIDSPWATTEDGCHFKGAFEHKRIGNTIHVRHIPTGNRFTIEVKDVPQ